MADEKYLSTLSGPELDAALRAATTVKEKVRAELQYAKDSGEFDGPQGIQGLQGPAGVLEVPGQIQDFESAAAVAGPSFNYYASYSTPLIEGVDDSKICGVTTLPANLWRYQMFLLGYSDLPTMLLRRLDEFNNPEDLEWVNPPMELGVEYRTVRRYMGESVYTKAVNFGPLPNNGISYAVGDFPSGIRVASLTGIARQYYDGGGGYYISREYPFPLMIDGGGTGIVYFDEYNGGIVVKTDFDASGFTAVFIMEYIKT